MVPVQTDAPLTVIVAEAIALAGVELVSFSATLAMFNVGLAAAAVTVAVRETEAVVPMASVPKVQLTVVVPVQVPWLGVADTNLSPAGRTSVTVTPVELDGPLLATVRV